MVLQLLILVGLPGSGKSTFARLLTRGTNGRFVTVSQDELRSRRLCEEEFSKAAMSTPRTAVKVVLDRCNVEPKDRAEWLELAMRPKSAMAVFFDVPVAVCKQRVRTRADHPTIPLGSGETVIESFARRLVPPRREEGFLDVRVVKTVEEARALVREFGGDLSVIADSAPAPAAESPAVIEEKSDDAGGEPSSSSPSTERRLQTLTIMDEAEGSSAPHNTAEQVKRPAMAKPVKGETTAAKGEKGKGKGKAAARAAAGSDEEGGEEDGFRKFPRTRHIVDMGSATRDDLLYTEAEAKEFYAKGHPVSIEEKVDGANLGLSISTEGEIRAQNRSHYVNSSTHRQFGQLDAWIEQHRAALFEILEPGRHVLFGEWLYAKHSIFYSRLPSLFLAFDIYDRQEGVFLSHAERTRRLEGSGISAVRTIFQGVVRSREELLGFLDQPSQFSDGPIEGIYCRIDEGPHLRLRGKIVRQEFLQGIEQHWTHQGIVRNKVKFYPVE